MFCKIKMQHVNAKPVRYGYMLYTLENESELCPSLKA